MEYNQTQIAELLGCNKSTICRELHRDQDMVGYQPDQAHSMPLMRRQCKTQPRHSDQVWQQIETLIRDVWESGADCRLACSGIGCVYQS